VTAQLVALVREGVLLALMLAAPLLVAALIAGVVTGLIGAFTQLQDAAIGVVPRVAALGVAIVLFAGPIARQLETFAGRIWPLIEAVGTSRG
jgi:flagellar biosynthesis protein FliQ